jgi:large subunit ribosomal protein L7/L12
MLRGAAALYQRSAVCAANAWEALTSQYITSLNTAHLYSTRCLSSRHFSEEASWKPDPSINPKPTARVLKLVDEVENLTVKEMVWFTKLLQERLGISDAELGIGVPRTPMAVAAPGAAQKAAPVAEEKPEQTEFDVIVEGYEAAAKIKVIKEVRTFVPGLGLKEGKELV